jgi:hypothetical protein
MNYSAVEKREKSLGELILVVMALSLLMAIFIYYFFKNENNINEAGFDNLAANFASKVILIRSQWLMDGRPNRVKLVEFDASVGKKISRWVTVNNLGWVDSNAKKLTCQDIWQQVMFMPMRFMKQPVSAIALKKRYDIAVKTTNTKLTNKGSLCRFSIKSGQFFEYSALNGKVNSGK